MRFVDKDGRLYKAHTPEKLVIELYVTSFVKGNFESAEHWVEGCVDRIEDEYDVKLNVTNAETFVSELKRLKIIMEIN